MTPASFYHVTHHIGPIIYSLVQAMNIYNIYGSMTYMVYIWFKHVVFIRPMHSYLSRTFVYTIPHIFIFI